MCVAELNVSTSSCRHRWYHLARPCSPGTNLANCPGKLGLSGWEIKCDFCPFCDSWGMDDVNYRLVGNDRNPSIGGLSRSGSTFGGKTGVGALSSQRRESRASFSGSRRSSLARTDSSGSVNLLARDTGEKNRAQLGRLDAYLSMKLDRSTSTSTSKSSDENLSEPSTPTGFVSDAGSKWYKRGSKRLSKGTRSFFLK